MKIGAGVQIGNPTGGDKGAGTINAPTICENGSALSSLLSGAVPAGAVMPYAGLTEPLGLAVLLWTPAFASAP